MSSEDYYKELKAWKSPIKVGKKIESEEEYEQAKKVFSDLRTLIDKSPVGYEAPDKDRGPFSLFFKVVDNSSTLESRIQAYERRTGKKKFKPDHMVHGRGGHLQ